MMTFVQRYETGQEGWQSVSSRLMTVEFLLVLVWAAVGAAAVWIALLIAQWLGIAVGVIAAVVVVSQLVITPRRVRSIQYLLRDDDFVFRRGVLFFRTVAVPYGRMQLVDVTRGPVSRILGLSELRLVTAAASSSVTVPGLQEAEAMRLRDVLVDRAESRRVGL